MSTTPRPTHSQQSSMASMTSFASTTTARSDSVDSLRPMPKSRPSLDSLDSISQALDNSAFPSRSVTRSPILCQTDAHSQIFLLPVSAPFPVPRSFPTPPPRPCRLPHTTTRPSTEVRNLSSLWTAVGGTGRRSSAVSLGKLS
jgi:hypothetical protein